MHSIFKTKAENYYFKIEWLVEYSHTKNNNNDGKKVLFH